MITNTQNQGLKEDVYQFEVVSIPAQVTAGDYLKWSFEFKPFGMDIKPIKASFFDNQMGELLLALGCKQVDEGVFDWEPAEVYGKQVKAKLIYESDKNGRINEKTGKIATYRRLVEFEPVANSSNPDGASTPEMIAWEE